MMWRLLQVPRILNPVVLVLDSLPQHCKDPHLRDYVHSVFGSVEGCRCAALPALCCGIIRNAFFDHLPAQLSSAPGCALQRLCSCHAFWSRATWSDA